jgi:hypothetical protein
MRRERKRKEKAGGGGGGGTYPAHADPAAAEEVDVLLLDEELHHGGAEAGIREHANLLGDVAETQGSVNSNECDASREKSLLKSAGIFLMEVYGQNFLCFESVPYFSLPVLRICIRDKVLF